MKSRPILFSGPMVRALLAGTKTQTRRIVKPQPVANGYGYNKTTFEVSCRCDYLPPDCLLCGDDYAQPFLDRPERRCPYGVPGDQLWVRESITRSDGCAFFNADREVVRTLTAWGWKRDALPSIHLPRAHSRITLAITGVRVERLQEISEADAIAEGLKHCPPTGDRTCDAWVFPDSGYDRSGLCHGEASTAYAEGWEQINGAGSWDANPWVWVVDFKRVAP